MNILHITINTLALERRIHNQIKCAQAGKHHVAVMFLDRKDPIAPNSDLPGMDSIPLMTPFHKGGPFKFIHYNWLVLKNGFTRNSDLIHVHDLWVLPSATILAAWQRIPMIYDAHEYYAGLEIFTRRRFRKWLWLIAERLCIKQVTHLITVSEPLADLYRKKYNLAIPVSVIRNLPEFEVPDKTKTVKLPVKQDKLNILYHGHFKPGRGLENLIFAVTKRIRVQLILIGGGELEATLKALTKQYDIEDRVVFLPYIANHQIISTAAQADIGVVLFQPSSENYAHALPNKFFEYLMAGLPVLASNIDTFESYVHEFGLGLTVDPDNIDAIGATLERIETELQLLNKWRKNVRSAAREFNWGNESEKLAYIYDSIKS